jgi:uncharacterized protein (UPF0333 family)
MFKKVLIILIVIVLIGVGYYLLSPLFINVKIDEAPPVSNSQSAVLPLASEAENKTSQIIGTSGHPASGSLRIVSDGTDTYIRYENFKTINGPDIYVYLANDLEAKDFVSLGRVKATEGNVNYKIPDDIRVSEYKYVMVWCKAFGVLFNYADISSL